MKRSVQTVYFLGNSTQRKKINRASSPQAAIAHAVRHLYHGTYPASRCEIYSRSTGRLYAVIRFNIGKRTISILYRSSNLTEGVPA